MDDDSRDVQHGSSVPPMTSEPLRVLLVEDSEDDAELVVWELRRAGFEPQFDRVQQAETLEDALDRQAWDLVIADYTMPGFSGLEALAIVKARGLDTPFLIVSGSIGEDIAVDAMRAGAHDYVMKGALARLGPAVRRELAESKVRSERRLMAARIEHDSLHDALTGLANRALLLDRLDVTLARARRPDSHAFGVLVVSLDRFEVVIGSLGHAAADTLLVAFARALGDCVGPGDTLARLGEDEFAILLDDMATLGTPLHVSDRLHVRLSLPFRLEGQDVFVTASVGIVLDGTDHERPDDVLRDAKTAMHGARLQGPGRTEVFDRGMHAHAMSVLRLQSDLRHALDRDELVLHYQPIVSLPSGALVGFEALVRWQHPERGLVMPEEFIPAAEDNGLIVPLGTWVLREACRQAREWQLARPAGPHCSVSVNVSAAQFTRIDLVAHVEGVLRKTGLDPSLLHLEITESVLMANAQASTDVLSRLKALGVGLHVDDFGTGHSSLSYLHRFPLDLLKIDQSFVRDMAIHTESREIVRTITLLAREIGLGLIAEGVETQEQRSALESFSCGHAQGFLFSPPLHADEASQLAASGRQW